MLVRVWLDGGQAPIEAGVFNTCSLASDDKGVLHAMADGKKLGQYDEEEKCWRVAGSDATFKNVRLEAAV